MSIKKAVRKTTEVSDEESDNDFLSAEENHSEPEDSTESDYSTGADQTKENHSKPEDSTESDYSTGADEPKEDNEESDSSDEDEEMLNQNKSVESYNGELESESDKEVSDEDQQMNGASDTNDSGDDAESSDNEDENSGWADAMSKILKTNKPQRKRTLVLSRAKKISDIKKVKKGELGFEIVGDGEVKTELDQVIKTEDDDEPLNKKRRDELPNLRVKPNILEKGKEKILSKIATRGVVQLFNAVRKQQKDIETKTVKEGPLERKKEKVIKSLDKQKFLDMLMGQTKSKNVNKELIKKESKKEVKDEDSTWSVFREDFISGAKMKDWDKKDNETNDQESDLNDSDSD